MRKIVFSVIVLMSSFVMQGQVIERVWATDRVLSTPESVLYQEQINKIYVSNVNGKPSVKDGNGFISLLDTTGKVISLKWVAGMDAPKGMAIYGDTLFVSDIDKIRLVSISQAKLISTVDVPGAAFLNDVVATDEGVVYITDTQKNKIFRLKNDSVTDWLEDKLLVAPNGLALCKGDLLVGVKNSILKVNINSKSVREIISDTGPVDGLICLGNKKYLISNWAGRVLIASPGKKIVLFSKSDGDVQTADLGYIPDKKIVLVPTFFDNRIIASRIVKINDIK